MEVNEKRETKETEMNEEIEDPEIEIKQEIRAEEIVITWKRATQRLNREWFFSPFFIYGLWHLLAILGPAV